MVEVMGKILKNPILGKLFIFVNLSISSAANANYGEYVGYEVTQAGWLYQTEYYSVTGYNPEQNDWTLFYHFIGPRMRMGYMHVENLNTGLPILNNCEQNKGVRESVTVKAGVFDSCRVQDGDNTVWYANVPYKNIIKVVPNKGRFTYELVCYSNRAQSVPCDF
jgi:hypothetical protein